MKEKPEDEAGESDISYEKKELEYSQLLKIERFQSLFLGLFVVITVKYSLQGSTVAFQSKNSKREVF